MEKEELIKKMALELKQMDSEKIKDVFAEVMLSNQGEYAKDRMMTLLVSATASKSALNNLKDVAIECREYEIASWLRELEKSRFPDTDEVKAIKKKVETFQAALALCEIKAPEEVVYKVIEASEKFNAIGEDFSVKDAAEIIVKTKEIYG
jgi:hypothetical protein